MRGSETATVGYVDLIRSNRNFRWLWGGEIVSLLGDWFNLIASASLIAQLSGSGLAIGGLFVVRMLAPFIVLAPAGVVADRYNRRKILIMTDLLRGVIVIGFLFIREPGHLWLLYLLTALQFGLSGFFVPARTAILPDIVSPRELGTANALSASTWSVMLALGTAIGGVVAGLLGTQAAFAIDSVTFFVSALLISRVVARPTALLSAAERTLGAALRQYVDGLRYLRDHADTLVIALLKAGNSLFAAGGMPVVTVAISESVFVYGEGGGLSLGLLYAVTGVGTGVGPLVARHFTGDRDGPMRRAIVISFAISSIGILLIATLASFPLVLLGTFLRGFGGGTVWVLSTQLLLQKVPGAVRGRIFASEFAIFTLMAAGGAAVTGTLLDLAIPLAVVTAMFGLLILLPGLLWWLWNRSRQPVGVAAYPDDR